MQCMLWAVESVSWVEIISVDCKYALFGNLYHVGWNFVAMLIGIKKQLTFCKKMSSLDGSEFSKETCILHSLAFIFPTAKFCCLAL
jgi:hypothetical protein